MPKPSGEDAGQSYPRTGMLPDTDRAALSVMAICKPQQMFDCQRSFRKSVLRIALEPAG
jgi:hypothetical protein